MHRNHQGLLMPEMQLPHWDLVGTVFFSQHIPPTSPLTQVNARHAALFTHRSEHSCTELVPMLSKSLPW